MTMKKQAKALAKAGRYGDDSLVHMNKREIAALEGIASLAGRRLTKNPKTGATEAFNLFDILPLALNFIAPGMGTAAQIAISAASGAASAGMEGRDPLTGALMGGITSGIAGNLFGGATPGEEAMKAISAGDMSKLSPEALKTVTQGPLGPGVMESALPEKYMTDLFGAGSDAAIDSTLGSLLSKQNLPLTLMGASMIAPMLDQPTDGSSVRPNYSPNLRNPGPARQYTPFTGDYSTYGQTGGEAMQVYQPGRLGQSYQYTGSEYEGDPRDYPFAKGGEVARYAGGGMIKSRTYGQPQSSLPNVPPLNIPRGPGQGGMASRAPNFSPPQQQMGPAPRWTPMDMFNIGTNIQQGRGAWGKGNRQGQPVGQPTVQPPAQTPITQNTNLVAGSMGAAAGGGMNPTMYTPPGPQGVLQNSSMMASPGSPTFSDDQLAQMRSDRAAYFAANPSPQAGTVINVPGQVQGKANNPFPNAKGADVPQINPGLTVGTPQAQMTAMPTFQMQPPTPAAPVDRTGITPDPNAIMRAQRAMAMASPQSPDSVGYNDFMAQRSGALNNMGMYRNALRTNEIPAFARGGIASVPGKVDPGITQAAMSSKKKDNGPRFIGGDHKGMDDTIPAKIDGKTPAKLSSGEFVIPADVVSMLGDGNTAAGARALREMMQRIRVQKTGNGQQAEPLNEMDVMPA